MPFHTAVAETYQHVKRERNQTTEEEQLECEKQVGPSLGFLTDYRVDDTGPLEVEAAPAEDDAPESFLDWLLCIIIIINIDIFIFHLSRNIYIYIYVYVYVYVFPTYSPHIPHIYICAT